MWLMLLDPTDERSTLVQVMAGCRQATSHYLSKWWPRSLSPYGVTGPQWVDMIYNMRLVQQMWCRKEFERQKNHSTSFWWASCRAPPRILHGKWQYHCAILLQTYVPLNRKKKECGYRNLSKGQPLSPTSTSCWYLHCKYQLCMVILSFIAFGDRVIHWNNA